MPKFSRSFSRIFQMYFTTYFPCLRSKDYRLHFFQFLLLFLSNFSHFSLTFSHFLSLFSPFSVTFLTMLETHVAALQVFWLYRDLRSLWHMVDKSKVFAESSYITLAFKLSSCFKNAVTVVQEQCQAVSIWQKLSWVSVSKSVSSRNETSFLWTIHCMTLLICEIR